MNTTPHAVLAGAGLLLALGLAGCNKPSEPVAARAEAASSAEAVAANVSDIDVTEHVKTALLRSDMLHGLDITVVTTKGDVSLTGTLSAQAQVDEATRIARAAEGVHAVHDHLTVKN
jgi:hyperosmotically inducible periplasmic protein